jgi:LytS/YehU family sensor histidine kinase
MIALRAQMNPHFLYNVLVSIQSFIFTNQKQDANVYLGKFADLMRKILSMSEKQEISLQEEIEALELYLELENIRFEGKLNCNIKIDPLLSPEMISIPSMILQPYVENAIKHGLLHRRGDKELNISFKALNDGKQMSIEIEDNGIGRKASEGINRKRRNKPGSFASNAILSRLQILNSIRKDKIQSQILDKYNSEGVSDGTLVRIILPIQIFK